MIATPTRYQVTWEKLPDDFVLDDEPVDNVNQPAIAAALTESLELAGRLPANALTPTNYGICATVNGQLVIKAPDWAYIPPIHVPRADVERSYTPHLQGELPVVVIEFISNSEGTEYSSKPTFPPGKWFFYEQILKIPNYVIFEPATGAIEAYQLQPSERYELQPLDANHRFLISQMDLWLGVWQGTRENRSGYWLRWWDEAGHLLLWGTEQSQQEQQRTEQEQQRTEQERQRAEQERQRAEQERQRADRLAAQLRAAGIEPEV